MPAQKLPDRQPLQLLKVDAASTGPAMMGVGSAGNLPPNASAQGLVDQGRDDDEDSNGSVPVAVSIGGGHVGLGNGRAAGDAPVARNRRLTGPTSIGGVTAWEWVTVAVLFYVNLINYMDRYTIAGILTDIQGYYHIDNDKAGLLQTAFVLSYMIFAPLFGYLGDRYSRKNIMAVGVFLWCLTTLLGSFMEKIEWFLLCRALVGIGEASYSTIAPTIISDLFVKDVRSKMLALFYFAIPVGCGMGYIIGSETAKHAGQWQWGLRVTPVMGAIAVVLILLVMIDPPRGESEGAHLRVTSWGADIKALCKNKSFVFSTLGFTCVAFVTGALAWWGPTAIFYGKLSQPGNDDTKLDDISYIFGIITMLAGILGVPIGSYAAQRLRVRYPRADPLICAMGLLVSTPLLFLAMILGDKNTNASFALVFFGQFFVNMNWAIVADILLYVVIPTRRSTAEAFQILISHAFGDAGSPYLVGQVSVWIQNMLKTSSWSAATTAMPNSTTEMFLNVTHSMTVVTTEPYLVTTTTIAPAIQYTSLEYALFITSFVELLGAVFFFITAYYLLHDKSKVDRIVAHEGLLDEHAPQPTHLYADDPSYSEHCPNLVT